MPVGANLSKPNNSFMWDLKNYDMRKKEYTIKNRVTGEVRSITRDRYLELLKEQGVKNENSP